MDLSEAKTKWEQDGNIVSPPLSFNTPTLRQLMRFFKKNGPDLEIISMSFCTALWDGVDKGKCMRECVIRKSNTIWEFGEKIM